MSTPLSSASAYLTAAEFLKRYDARTVGNLASDTGTQVSASSLTSDANLAAVLNDASGMVEMACVMGNRYSPTDLNALTGMSKSALQRIVADLAFGLLNQRRPDKSVGAFPAFESALKMLDSLADGDLIFGLQEVADAGNIKSVVETAVTVENRNMTTYQAGRYFGRRSNRQDGW